MAWASVIVGGASALGGMFASNSAANAQKSAADQNYALAQQQMQLGQGVYNDSTAAAQQARDNQNRIAQTTYAGQMGTAADVRDAQIREAGTSRDAQLGYYQPYVASGQDANAAYNYNLGIGAKPQGYTGFEGSQGYQYNLGEQQGAIQGSAAASGNALSGATMEALQTNASGLASQDYNTYMGQLNGQQMLGYDAAGRSAGIEGNYGATTQNALSGYGNAAYNAGATQGAMKYGTQADYANNMIGAGNSLTGSSANALGYMTDANNDQGNAAAAGYMAPWNATMGGVQQGIGLWGYQNALNGSGTPTSGSNPNWLFGGNSWG